MCDCDVCNISINNCTSVENSISNNYNINVRDFAVLIDDLLFDINVAVGTFLIVSVFCE